MNVVIRLSDLDPDVREALRRRVETENKPLLQVGCEVLAQALHAADAKPAASSKRSSRRKEGNR